MFEVDRKSKVTQQRKNLAVRENNLYTPITLEHLGEERARALLLEHFTRFYKDRTCNYVDGLLARSHYIDRFLYLEAVVGSNLFKSSSNVLVSGFGAGSEMVVAREFGLGDIYGVEVDQVWVDVCKLRFENMTGMYPAVYLGAKLPFDDAVFDLVMSGHIIEHTLDPQQYINESLRVLKSGSYLSLEFPTRYHYRELHTGLISFEWLPQGVRNGFLRLLCSNYSPLPHQVKAGYSSITSTALKQISMCSIHKMLKASGYMYSVINVLKPAPGVVRCVIKKTHD